MQHPTMMGNDGKPKIQLLNKRTVDSGKAGKMGYIPVQSPEAPPIITEYRNDAIDTVADIEVQLTTTPKKTRNRKASITKASPVKTKA